MFTVRTSSPRPGTFAAKRSRMPSSGWMRSASRFGSGSVADVAEQHQWRHLLELDRDLGGALGQPLAGAQVERHAAQRQFSTSSLSATKVSVSESGSTSASSR